MADRPEYLIEGHLNYLDSLRESGITNMLGARPYLMRAFPMLDREQAGEIMQYWMLTFEARHPE